MLQPYCIPHCRDNKGRIYIADERSGRETVIARFTSEGVKETEFNLPTGASSHHLMLASDYSTGSVYVFCEVGGSFKQYRLKENGTKEELTGVTIPYPIQIAVYNNIVVIVDWHALSMYRIDGTSLSSVTVANPPQVEDNIKIDIGSLLHSEIKDLYMTDDSLYLLFSAFGNEDPIYYALGGVVKYTYSINGTNGTIKNPVRIGIKDSHTAEEYGSKKLFKTDGATAFYGPVKVIGFDEDNLYIADDGAVFEYKNEKIRLTANKNRIVTLRKADNSLTFQDASTTWLWEEKEWKKPQTKALVWKKVSPDKDMNYWLVNNGDEAVAETPAFIQSESTSSVFKDLFCYDFDGNVYVAGKGSGHAQVFYYELKDDGSYKNASPIGLYGVDVPAAIAVGTSSVPNDEGQTILFYYMEDSSNPIKRISWQGSEVNTANSKDDFDTDIGSGDTITALAVDATGVYAAVKTVTGQESTDEKYKIEVRKYKHQPLSGGHCELIGKVTVVPETKTHWSALPSHDRANKYICEELNALHIQDGVVYGLTTKRIGGKLVQSGHPYYPAKSVITGKLLKIGAGTVNFSGACTELYTSGVLSTVADPEASEISGSFAPYRFIAVKPKKLVVASDGYYAPTNQNSDMKQKNKVFVFDIDNFNNPDIKEAKIEFSKTISSSFEW